MLVGAAEAFVVLGVVVLSFGLLASVRRRLERWFACRLSRLRRREGGRVVVLERRADGTFGRGDRNGR